MESKENQLAMKRKAALKDRKREFMRTLKQTRSVDEACKILMIPKQTVFRWLRHDAELQKRFFEIRKDSIMELEELAFQQALAGSEKQIQFLLKAWNRDQYAPESNVNLNVSHDIEVRVAGKDPQLAQREIASKMIEQLRNVPGGMELIEHVENYNHVPSAREVVDLESEQYRVVEDDDEGFSMDEGE